MGLRLYCPRCRTAERFPLTPALVAQLPGCCGREMAGAFGGQMAALSYLIVADPGSAASVAIALADLTWLWGIGLAVLGVYVGGRTVEKQGGARAILRGLRLPLPGRRPNSPLP